MRIGLVVPQGWTGEYAGRAPRDAWARTLAVARRAETAGFESLWAYDHVQTTPEPVDAPVLESWTVLAALATATTRVRLGQLVGCAGYRNPALAAKIAATLDAISGGRAELALGAGWKRDEFEAYGFGWEPLRVRQERLEDAVRIARAMFGPGRATVAGRHASVRGAVAEPKPVRAAGLPILVGGNGRDVTWAIAARHADELNVDAMPADEIAGARADLAARCREAGRDPATLRLSVHLWWEHVPPAGEARVAHLRAYREAGVDRVMTLLRDAATDPAAVDRLADDARAAGAEMGAG